METSRQELVNAIEERDQLLTLVTEISDSMERIRRLENIMTTAASSDTTDALRRRNILAEMTELQMVLRRRREELAAVEQRLQDSAHYSEGLRLTVEALRRNIDNQTVEIDILRGQLTQANRRIEALSSEVDSLSTTVVTVSRELGEAQAESEKLVNELNTCYYLIAGKSVLKEHRIIQTGFLRRTTLNKGGFDKGLFTVGDKRTLSDIDLHSDKINILTNHPEDSYQIIETGKDKSLVITSPDLFWSMSNYLVIQID